ncbi:MAG: F0F1 ATP synthase subunit B [Bacteroidetes bacterium]|nr:F0F1 ATP synthase subunit B [Bacteroidota bacterium]
MEIDWFTFGAQIANFLILVGLLKRFLYGPILEAMDRREETITARLDDAREKRAEAEREAETYRSMQEEFERERDERRAEAERAAEERRQQLIHEARTEVEQLEEEWHEALARERASFLEDLSERAVKETIAVARRALNDLADARLEAQSFEIFLERLRTLEGAPRRDLAEALQSTKGAATVRSTFGLSDQQQDRVRNALTAYAEETPALTTETDDTLGFGVELRVGDRKVAWTLDSYLTHLLDRVRERLEGELERSLAAGEEAMAEPAASNEE